MKSRVKDTVAAAVRFCHEEVMRSRCGYWKIIRGGASGMALALLAGAGTGCVQLKLDNATGSARYAPVVGKRYELAQDFILQSVREEVGEAPRYARIIAKPIVYIPQYDPRNRRYDPRGKPGYVTRFVTDLGFLPAGTRFSVVGVLTRGAPMTQVHYVIAIEGDQSQIAGHLPVRLSEQWGKDVYLAPAAAGEAPKPCAPFFGPVEK